MNGFTVVFVVFCVGVVVADDSQICPSDDSVAYFPAEDCSQFWQCTEGKPIIQNCPQGLQFNTELNICDWPSNARCANDDDRNNKIPEEKEESDNDNDNQNGNGNNGGEIKEVQICENVECPAEDPDVVVQKPGPSPSQFCKCSHGIPYLLACKDGLVYNADLEVCDYPENETDDRPNNSDEENESKEEANDENNITCQGDCPETDGTPLASSNSNNFCVCGGGVQHVMKCPDGLIFNVKEGICDWP
ncbi:peritrophin-1-like [Diabrotica virgifera virgifera]|uniref:Peritrophin-1-like n=1 Tax=Diabrotica virgifera virgifera TaxID=50390 RepID=A0A6P7FT14_DIAVI|nr:peritrophin-1-like [Diabrotica virgifera virgifera]